MKLAIGTVLTATTNCKMKDGSGNALIIGKEYPIKQINDNFMVIETELFLEHYFYLDKNDSYYYGLYFNI